MKALLGIRDSLALFYSMHDTVLNLFLKFSALTALCCLILTGSCGGTIADPVRYLPALAAGAAGCLLPGASAILPLCVWIVFCAWLCSLEAALAAAVLELLFLLLFFSFFPDDAWVVITVMLLCLLKIPSAAVLAGALLLELNAVPGIPRARNMLARILTPFTITSVSIELKVSCIPMNQPRKAIRLRVAGAAQILMKKYLSARDLTSAEQSTRRNTSFWNGHWTIRSASDIRRAVPTARNRCVLHSCQSSRP